MIDHEALKELVQDGSASERLPFTQAASRLLMDRAGQGNLCARQPVGVRPWAKATHQTCRRFGRVPWLLSAE